MPSPNNFINLILQNSEDLSTGYSTESFPSFLAILILALVVVTKGEVGAAGNVDVTVAGNGQIATTSEYGTLRGDALDGFFGTEQRHLLFLVN